MDKATLEITKELAGVNKETAKAIEGVLNVCIALKDSYHEFAKSSMEIIKMHSDQIKDMRREMLQLEQRIMQKLSTDVIEK